MSGDYDIGANGLVIGWEPALLGNALSSLANLFVFSRRTGVPAVYPYIDTYAELFQRGSPKYIGLAPSATAKADAIVCDLDRYLSGHPVLMKPPEAVPLKNLASAPDGIAVSTLDPRLHDWRENDEERIAADFCRRGNILLLAGAYWRQYCNMRELHAEGKALRDHLGPLRQDGCKQRLADMTENSGSMKIAIHMRRADDYKDWHGGQYFFSQEQYASLARRLCVEIGSRSHAIYLFSDEPIDLEVFRGLPVKSFKAGLLDDLVALGTCDYILGAPSTFGTWAAFLGGAKRIIMNRDRFSDMEAGRADLLDYAVEIPFPTGHYLPGMETAGPI